MARTTTRSGKREMNPTDAYRKLQRKKEVQKNKKERKKVREFSAMVRNPDLMVEEVRFSITVRRHRVSSGSHDADEEVDYSN